MNSSAGRGSGSSVSLSQGWRDVRSHRTAEPGNSSIDGISRFDSHRLCVVRHFSKILDAHNESVAAMSQKRGVLSVLLIQFQMLFLEEPCIHFLLHHLPQETF